MKSLRIFTLFLAVLFLSCDKEDEDTTPIDAQSLIGKWAVTSFIVDINIDGEIAEIPLNSSTKSVGENFDYILTLTETTYTVEGSYDIVTTGKINGVPFDADTQTIDRVSETGTYSFSEDSITFDGVLFEFDANDVEFSEFSEDQALKASFNTDGELVFIQNVATDIAESPINTSVDSTIKLKRIE
ncbi:hypothetical protein [Maribacter sp. 2304DJ31-5]|uniref:hypothetical protein n=1 Tax=Maribacter sp. 2304DJ31-5 TaxID=3386273 RepID=UPI0039BD7BAE